MLGDINGDGVLNAKDLRIIRNYISGNYEEIPFTAVVECGDVNLDGEIDDVDLMILSKYISDGGKYNPEGYAIKLPYASGEKYTISYNLDGGVVKNSNIKTYAQISLPYTLNNPTKEGYVFIGWTGSNGNTPQTEVTITEGTTGNLEYTANWEKVN